MIPRGISEIQSGARTQSRKEAVRRRASRLERRAMREGRGHAVGFGNGCSVRACSHGVFGADGSLRPAAGIADESFGECGRENANCFRNGTETMASMLIQMSVMIWS